MVSSGNRTRQNSHGKAIKVSIVIPCYNEKETLEEIAAEVGTAPVDSRIIVMDDCSEDGTRGVLKEKLRQSVRDREI